MASVETRNCPVCGEQIKAAARKCRHCGEIFEQTAGQNEVTEGDSTGGLIPYKNPKALTAYYLGLFSFIPCLGLPLGIAALVLGIMGLRARSRNPVIKGSVHAWIGILVGGFFALLWTVVAVIATLGSMRKF